MKVIIDKKGELTDKDMESVNGFLEMLKKKKLTKKEKDECNQDFDVRDMRASYVPKNE